MELVLATTNPNKREEIVSLLSDLGCTIRTMDEFDSIPQVIEDGETCQANAMKKAMAAARHTGLIALADDTGLEVEALGGRPGVYAARYAGEEATYEDNWRKLLGELEGVPAHGRAARFLTAVAIIEPYTIFEACIEPEFRIEVVEGVLDGQITKIPSGTEGFGYDPVFFVPELGKTLAQLTLEQKNTISHRARALAKVKEVLKEKISQT